MVPSHQGRHGGNLKIEGGSMSANQEAIVVANEFGDALEAIAAIFNLQCTAPEMVKKLEDAARELSALRIWKEDAIIEFKKHERSFKEQGEELQRLQLRNQQWASKFHASMDTWASQSVEWQEERVKLQGLVEEVRKCVSEWRDDSGGWGASLWLSEIENILEHDFTVPNPPKP